MKKFKTITIILAAIGLVLILLAVVFRFMRKNAIQERANTSCVTEERVFDFADVLTDDEEESLRELIAETEPEIGCDIVLVTIEDSDLASDYAMMNFADDFYDNNMFGWNEPWGDGALYLDNWGRDAYGDAYTWFSTCGKVEDRYSTAMIDDLINDVCSNVNDNPYSAYVKYVKTLKRDMTDNQVQIPWGAAPIAGIIAAVIFIMVNLPTKMGKVTTGKQTYVNKEDVKMLNQEDTFLSKNVTHVRVSSSSSGGHGGGGGGGHHVSSGGHSHGGGGGRH